MSDISKINPNNGMNVYDLKDSVCRTALTVSDPTEGDGVITFGVDADGNYGYKKVGADTVTPFKSGSGGVTGFGSDYLQSLNVSDTTSTSITRYRHPISQNSDITFSNISLTKGTWITILHFGTSNDTNIKIKDINNNYISADSHILIDIVNSGRIGLFMFNIDENITINAFQLTISSAIYAYSAKTFNICFIKLQ